MPRRSSMRSIDGRSLDLDDVVAVARQAERVALAPAAAKRVDASRRALEKVIAKGSLAYGIKTGFGELASVEISDADVRTLQLNLLRSHAIGQGPPLPGANALATAKLAPLSLQSKEGLAIINGPSVMAGVGALVVNDGLRLLKDAQVAASLSFEALRGSPKPFDDRLIALKPQPGAREVASNLRRLLRGSEIVPSHKGPHKVQDPYTLRCIPQVLGAVRAALDGAAACLRIEMNAATDNPLIFPEGTSVSGGNFHAQSLSMALDHVALGMAVLAGFSERRIARLVDTRLSELPPFLTQKSGLNSGMMIVQYVAAGYASENKVLAHPASADSNPPYANQEDFVPMGMAAALKARQSLENAARVVGLEVLAAAQGLEFLKPLRPGAGPRAAYEFVRSGIPPLVEDRSLAPDANRILEWMATGQLLGAVESAAGRLA